MKTLSLTSLLAAVLVSTNAFAAGHDSPAPARQEGGMLVGSDGMTLYTFDKDEAGAGKSLCNGKCAENWPPLLAAEADRPAGDYSVVSRDDGRKQWAFKGKPLYFWSKDRKAGDATGDGFNNVWRIAR